MNINITLLVHALCIALNALLTIHLLSRIKIVEKHLDALNHATMIRDWVKNIAETRPSSEMAKKVNNGELK